MGRPLPVTTGHFQEAECHYPISGDESEETTVALMVSYLRTIISWPHRQGTHPAPRTHRAIRNCALSLPLRSTRTRVLEGTPGWARRSLSHLNQQIGLKSGLGGILCGIAPLIAQQPTTACMPQIATPMAVPKSPQVDLEIGQQIGTITAKTG